MGILQRRGSVVANRVLSGDNRKLIANEAGSFEYYRAFGGSGNFYCEILRSLNTPPLPSLAQVSQCFPENATGQEQLYRTLVGSQISVQVPPLRHGLLLQQPLVHVTSPTQDVSLCRNQIRRIAPHTHSIPTAHDNPFQKMLRWINIENITR